MSYLAIFFGCIALVSAFIAGAMNPYNSRAISIASGIAVITGVITLVLIMLA